MIALDWAGWFELIGLCGFLALTVGVLFGMLYHALGMPVEDTRPKPHVDRGAMTETGVAYVQADVDWHGGWTL